MNAPQPVLKSFKAQAASELTNVKKDDAFKIPPGDLMEEPGFNERDYSDPLVIEQIRKFANAYKAGLFVPPVIVRIDPATGNRYMVEGQTLSLPRVGSAAQASVSDLRLHRQHGEVSRIQRGSRGDHQRLRRSRSANTCGSGGDR